MSVKRGSNQWFAKFAMILAVVLVFGMPAIYWACGNLLGMDFRNSVESTFKEIFAQSGAGDLTEGDSGDSGGD